MIPISIGVMAYNEEKNIKALLERLLNQKLSHFFIKEIIVVSSACTDKTDEIVADLALKHPVVELIKEKERKGKYSSINIFLKKAKSKILVLESADTLPTENTIERLCLPLLNKRIGITGTHPIPKNKKNTFPGYIVNFEWQLLHQISFREPKFGEMMAFRKVLDKIPATAVDEEEIVRIIKSKGYKGKYVPKAVVYNYGPETITDIIKQRRRTYAGHRALQKRGYKVPTIKNLNILKLVLKTKNKKILWTFGAVIVETYARLLGFLDYSVFKKKHIIWDISKTTKNDLKRKDYSEVTIIIPTLNEEKNIGELIEYIIAHYPKIKIVVADDNSKDRTPEIITKISEKNKNVLLSEKKKYEIKGLTAGVLRALEKVNTEKTIVMDGDFQHPPEKIKDIVDCLENYELVVGKRRSVKKWGVFRKVMSRIATFLGKLRLTLQPTKCQDIMSGFFGIKTKRLKNCDMGKFQLEGYKILFDFLKQNKKKISTAEIEYDFGIRLGGTSKIGRKEIKAFLKSLLR